MLNEEEKVDLARSYIEQPQGKQLGVIGPVLPECNIGTLSKLGTIGRIKHNG